MRDPNQLELNFGDKTVEPTTQEQDAAVQARLERMEVLTHLNAIHRGHRAWSERAAPTTEAMVRYCQYLRENPEDLGNQYSMILIEEMMKRMSVTGVKREVVIHYSDVL